jgi:hypothetical protein
MTPEFNRKAPSVLLLGDIGCGKTHAIRTLLNCCEKVFVLATEYTDVLEDTDPQRLHWHYIPPIDVPWDVMINNAKMVNMMSNEALQKWTDPNRSKYDAFMEVLKTFSNFKCDRTGKEFGDVSKWPTNWALVVDSLSGLSLLAKHLTVGAKPILSQPDWGVAMDTVEYIVNKLVFSCNCFFVLTAHIEKELNEVTGTTNNMVSTLGRKLPPKIPRYFSDVIHATREGTTFRWSTATPLMSLKSRNLPIGQTYEPNFQRLFEQWKARIPKENVNVNK